MPTSDVRRVRPLSASVADMSVRPPSLRRGTPDTDTGQAPVPATECDHQLPASRADRRFCSNACRQAAYRARKADAELLRTVTTMMTFFIGADMTEQFTRLMESRNTETLASRNTSEVVA